MINRLAAATLLTIVTLLGTQARAQTQTAGSESPFAKIFPDTGGITTVVGVRLWGNQWDIPLFDVVPVANAQAPGNVVLQDSFTAQLSGFEVAVIPFIGVRIGDVVASVGYSVRTDYDSKSAQLNNVSRDELDVTLGYSILPAASPASLVLSVGYKRATFEQTTILSVATILPIAAQVVDSTIDALILGVTGSAPLDDNWRLYGNAAYGFARQKNDGIPVDSNVNRELDGAYRVGEFGISYVFRGGEGQFFRNASVGLGYRAQIYTIKSFTFFTRTLTGAVISSESRDVDSTTQGPILTFTASF